MHHAASQLQPTIIALPVVRAGSPSANQAINKIPVTLPKINSFTADTLMGQQFQSIQNVQSIPNIPNHKPLSFTTTNSNHQVPYYPNINSIIQAQQATFR
jgi:hypothetical protein